MYVVGHEFVAVDYEVDAVDHIAYVVVEHVVFCEDEHEVHVVVEHGIWVERAVHEVVGVAEQKVDKYHQVDPGTDAQLKIIGRPHCPPPGKGHFGPRYLKPFPLGLLLRLLFPLQFLQDCFFWHFRAVRRR